MSRRKRRTWGDLQINPEGRPTSPTIVTHPRYAEALQRRQRRDEEQRLRRELREVWEDDECT